MKKLSRRDFLKGSAAVAATGLLATVAHGAEAAEETIQWDMEADVLISGAGAAGMCARGMKKPLPAQRRSRWSSPETLAVHRSRSGGIIQASGIEVRKKLTAYQDDTPRKHSNT